MSTSPAHRASSLNLKRAFLGVTLGFVFLAILIMVLGATSYQLSRTGSVRSAELSERLLPALEALAGVQEATLKYNLTNLEFVTGRDEETQARKLASAAEFRKHVTAHAQELTSHLQAPEAPALLQGLTLALQSYDAAIERLRTALKAN
jgi:hypothetical protein